jgi:hypothetical protein
MTKPSKDHVADWTVQTLYRSFPLDTLREMVAIGDGFEKESAVPPEVKLFNEALRRELAEREAQVSR